MLIIEPLFEINCILHMLKQSSLRTALLHRLISTFVFHGLDSLGKS